MHHLCLESLFDAPAAYVLPSLPLTHCLCGAKGGHLSSWSSWPYPSSPFIITIVVVYVNVV